MTLLDLEAVTRRAARIRCLFLDIDGVMTDCRLYLGPDGFEIKAVHVRDGYGMKQLLKNGVELAVISGRPSEAMRARMAFLGIRHVYLDTEDKLPAYEAIRDRLGLTDEECAHMGDDVPDLPLLERVGLAMCVADAHPRVTDVCHWQSRHLGGNGAIREAADLILEARSKA